MSRGKIVLATVVIGYATWLGGCAKALDPAAQQNGYWHRLAIELQQSTQPRERALAAQLFGIAALNEGGPETAVSGPQAVDPGIKASMKALIAETDRSEDAVALSLAVQAGNQIDDEAARGATARRWQAVEPDNLTPRLFTDTPIDALLSGARDATRYETHAYDQIRLMTSVFKRWPMSREEAGSGYSKVFSDDDGRAAVNAFAIWAAFGIPAFQKITNACKGEALVSAPTRREECLHVAKVLSTHSDDLLSRGMGIAMLERAANTPEDIALAVALRRNKEWQQHQYYQVLTQNMNEQQQVSDMLRLLKTPGVDNEIQLMQTALREKGIALTPPDDWQPPKYN